MTASEILLLIAVSETTTSGSESQNSVEENLDTNALPSSILLNFSHLRVDFGEFFKVKRQLMVCPSESSMADWLFKQPRDTKPSGKMPVVEETWLCEGWRLSGQVQHLSCRFLR